MRVCVIGHAAYVVLVLSQTTSAVLLRCGWRLAA